MRSLSRILGGCNLGVSTLALLAWALSIETSLAQDTVAAPCRPGCAAEHIHPRGHRASVRGGTLGYGPPGSFPGFQGFGLGYHRGYGYGGGGLGPGAGGGYPLYGGPGYPHPAPRLNRLGRIQPYAYNAGPGPAAPDGSFYFQEPGPLVVDPPIVSTNGARYDAAAATSYGPYTGAPPYPPATFAPFATSTGEEAGPESVNATAGPESSTAPSTP